MRFSGTCDFWWSIKCYSKHGSIHPSCDSVIQHISSRAQSIQMLFRDFTKSQMGMLFMADNHGLVCFYLELYSKRNCTGEITYFNARLYALLVRCTWSLKWKVSFFYHSQNRTTWCQYMLVRLKNLNNLALMLKAVDFLGQRPIITTWFV